MTHEEELLRVRALPMPQRLDLARRYLLDSEYFWNLTYCVTEAIESAVLARDILAQCVTDLDGLLVTMREPRR